MKLDDLNWSDDEKKLEEITEMFVKKLIETKFKDISKYRELEQRLANIINWERQFRVDGEMTKELMQFWPGERN